MTIEKALIVDDSKVAYVKLSKMLGQRNIQSDWASNGNDGLDYLREQRPDVVFMDIIMPDIDGFETTSRIRQNAAFDRLPVVICSSSTTEDDQAKAKASGANAFLAKPYTAEELDRILADVETTLAAAPVPATILGSAEGVTGELAAFDMPLRADRAADSLPTSPSSQNFETAHPHDTLEPRGPSTPRGGGAGAARARGPAPARPRPPGRPQPA
ncbi:MAG: response regulator, partial [Candidatus Competibacterales bacterium]